VLRLRTGDALAVFDGRGHEWRGTVCSVDRHGVLVDLGEPIEPALEPRVILTLAQAVLKGDHMDAAVRDATMMGVAAIQPLLTAHTVANSRAAGGAKARERWERIAIASAKQCRRAVVPRVERAAPIAEVLSALTADQAGLRILLAEPAAGRAARTSREFSPAPGQAWMAVGPEGGWAPAELDAWLAHGFQPLTLGARTIRAEAAGIVAISMLRAAWDDW
jgi:16S rRNA (uracil1498-N3)-methyltransferase